MENSKTARHPKNWLPVAYKRWPFIGGSNLKALTGNILVFWMSSGRSGEVVAHVPCPRDES